MSESAPRFRLMGLEPSPYTMKVESFLKYKGIPYDWVSRTMKSEKEFQENAQVQLIPLLFFPNGETMQDSTPILERLDTEYPEPGMHPSDPALWFLSCLFEEFGDEWCNKLMFFQRWFYDADAKATGERLARERLKGQWYAGLVSPIAARLLVRRMVPRLVYSGGNETNIPQLKQSFVDLSGCWTCILPIASTYSVDDLVSEISDFGAITIKRGRTQQRTPTLKKTRHLWWRI